MTELEQRIFKLLTEVMDLIGQTEEEVLNRGQFSNLSRSEMNTLKKIGLYDTKTMSETAELLNVTKGTLSVQVDRLVRKGYIVRKRRAEDRRVVEMRLTKKGKLAYRVHDRFNRLLLESILEPLDENQQEVMHDTLARVEDYLQLQYLKYSERKQPSAKKAGSVEVEDANDTK